MFSFTELKSLIMVNIINLELPGIIICLVRN